MSKIALEDVQTVLADFKISPDTQDKVIQKLQELIEVEKDNKERITRPKPQLGVILIDELGEIKNDNIGALIYEIPADGKHDDVMTNIRKSITEFNNTKKGQKSPVKSISEAFRVVKPKTFKANGGLKRKTKEIVRSLVTNNKI